MVVVCVCGGGALRATTVGEPLPGCACVRLRVCLRAWWGAVLVRVQVKAHTCVLDGELSVWDDVNKSTVAFGSLQVRLRVGLAPSPLSRTDAQRSRDCLLAGYVMGGGRSAFFSAVRPSPFSCCVCCGVCACRAPSRQTVAAEEGRNPRTSVHLVRPTILARLCL